MARLMQQSRLSRFPPRAVAIESPDIDPGEQKSHLEPRDVLIVIRAITQQGREVVEVRSLVLVVVERHRVVKVDFGTNVPVLRLEIQGPAPGERRSRAGYSHAELQRQSRDVPGTARRQLPRYIRRCWAAVSDASSPRPAGTAHCAGRCSGYRPQAGPRGRFRPLICTRHAEVRITSHKNAHSAFPINNRAKAASLRKQL